MVDSRIPAGNYPFSTQDGKAIPLDILKTRGLLISTFDAVSDSLITIPEGSEIAVLFSSTDCLFSIGSALGSLPADNSLKEKTFYIPASHAVTIVLEQGSSYVRGMGTGVLYVQLIERWVGMGLDTNYIRR